MKNGPVAGLAEVALPLHPDSDLSAMHRGVEEHHLLGAVLDDFGQQAPAGRNLTVDGYVDLILARFFDEFNLFQLGEVEHG